MDDFYLQSFWALCTERHYDYGPIPENKIFEYGLRKQLDGDIINLFIGLIRAMDACFLEWQSEENERKRRLSKIKNK